MKQRRTLLSVLLVCVLMAAKIPAPVHASGTDKQTDATASSSSAEHNPENKVEKDETVYVFAEADGNIEKIIVSDWLRNGSGSQTLTDRTVLSDIENVKGEETYSIQSDEELLWDAAGNDICYQGTIERELPVSVSISYTLDGEAISAKELIGKSGNVTIRFSYQSDQYQSLPIFEEEENIFVPFAVLQGTCLDGNCFRNVKVKNGKILHDGMRTFVLGYAFPGLQDNLRIDNETLDLPDYVEIAADVTDFHLGTSIAIATNEVFSELDIEGLSSFDDLTTSMSALTDGMDQLCDGSSSLDEGLCTLLEKSEELLEGTEALSDGAEQLKTGTADLSDGAEQLSEGMQELCTGLETLGASSDTLCTGAEQIFTSLLLTAEEQLTAAGAPIPSLTIENYTDVLNNVLSSLDETGLLYHQVLSLKASLDGVNTFYNGLTEYTAGVDSAATGAAELNGGALQLKEGASQLDDGAGSLYDGLLELNEGVPALNEGVSALSDGASQLSDGLKEYNENGIQPLAGMVTDDLGGIITRIKATIDVSGGYDNFSGISDDMNGRVKFIYRMEGPEGEF